MSAAYARKSILARVDRTITDDSCKDSDGAILKEFCCIADYPSVEFRYVKEKLGCKYGIKFKNCYKRSDVVEQWDKIKESLSITKEEKPMIKKSSSSKKSTKLRVITEKNWGNSCKEELSPSEALERFYKLKAEEKKQRLLEEVRNVDLLW